MPVPWSPPHTFDLLTRSIAQKCKSRVLRVTKCGKMTAHSCWEMTVWVASCRIGGNALLSSVELNPNPLNTTTAFSWGTLTPVGTSTIGWTLAL